MKKIAWPVKKEREEDHPIIFKEPSPTVIEILKKSNSRKEMWNSGSWAEGPVP